MKSVSVIFRVEATSPPTLTDAPWPNRIPLGFSRNSLPLADRVPRILEGSEPRTRLSATEPLLGCKNRTASPCPMLKLCQLIAAFCVDWMMVVPPVPLLILAPPAVTTPPAGNASAFVPHATMREIIRVFSKLLYVRFMWWLLYFKNTSQSVSRIGPTCPGLTSPLHCPA